MFLSSLDNQLFFTSAALGVFAHLVYFIYGERNNSSVRILRFIIGGVFFLFAVSLATNNTLAKGLLRGLIPTLGFFIGLGSSIIVYRLLFHPLRKFPGPWIDAISKWRAAYIAHSTGRYFERLQDLHKTYGDYIRTGPNELSINDVEALQAIYSSTSPCTRGPASDFRGPQLSLHRTRNPELHRQQKIYWQRGLKPRESYLNRINQQVPLLSSCLDSQHGPIDLTKKLRYYAFNVMAHITFSLSYEGEHKREALNTLDLMCKAQAPLGVASHVPWAYLIALSFPKWLTGLTASADFSEAAFKILQERLKMQPKCPDLTSCLLSSQNDTPCFSLREESRLSVVVGSVNTFIVPLVTVYYLTKHPEYQTVLYDELFPLFASNSFDISRSLSFLDACIYEAMRLQAVVPNGGERNTPPGGLQIGKHWIPGDVVVRVPIYTIFRDSRYFERPTEFNPYRWTTQTHLVKNSAVFCPFSIGNYKCAGRELGMMITRAAVAFLVTTYRFLPSETDMEAWEKSGVDAFTMEFPDLTLEFIKR